LVCSVERACNHICVYTHTHQVRAVHAFCNNVGVRVAACTARRVYELLTIPSLPSEVTTDLCHFARLVLAVAVAVAVCCCGCSCCTNSRSRVGPSCLVLGSVDLRNEVQRIIFSATLDVCAPPPFIYKAGDHDVSSVNMSEWQSTCWR